MDCVDVNKLKQDILNSWNNDTHRGYAASRIHWQEHQELMLIVARQPTADVVPRAVFEQLQHKYELAVAEREANVKGFTEDLAKAKTDTAREIFAEILRIIREYSHLACIAKNNYGITQMEHMGTDILKLKKKYTEGDNG